MFSSPLVFAGSTASGPEAAYLKENDVAMTRMMDAMSVDPTGDVDHDFVAMMIPHHQGAIDMAEAELRYGKNEQLRRIAQEIVIEQQQEIVAMHVALGQSQPPSSGSRGPTGGESNAAMGHAPVVGNDAMHMHGSQQMSTSEEK
ncbi:DUF305 domain-containing protein [Paraburkholderia sp. C35]|uniref:DUF305 domain-containing protein n=1 Tax=Paraburkholderia sp. C35 TaxID=2126993 RepID=UPI001EF5FE2A|nr:DUF305 domain-containing protein [Paraburkholderia sp. C35]